MTGCHRGWCVVRCRPLLLLPVAAAGCEPQALPSAGAVEGAAEGVAVEVVEAVEAVAPECCRLVASTAESLLPR